MASVNVIFTRPVRVKKIVYPKSKRSVAVDSAALESSFMKKLIEEGSIIIPVAKAAPAAAVPAKAGK